MTRKKFARGYQQSRCNSGNPDLRTYLIIFKFAQLTELFLKIFKKYCRCVEQ
jgi:hypothetical protein